jgi:hypothetical protein
LAAEEEAWKLERSKGLEEIQTLKQNAQEAQQAARKAEGESDAPYSRAIRLMFYFTDNASKNDESAPGAKIETDVAMDAAEGEL